MSENKPPRLKKDGTLDRRSPPKAHQFKPGQSGNPQGRAKQQKSLSQVVDRALTRKVRVKTAEGPAEMETLDVIVQALANKAMGGDERAFRELARHRSPEPDENLVRVDPEQRKAAMNALNGIFALSNFGHTLKSMGLIQKGGGATFLADWVAEEFLRRLEAGEDMGPMNYVIDKGDVEGRPSKYAKQSHYNESLLRFWKPPFGTGGDEKG